MAAFSTNMGTAERIARVVVGIALLGFALVGPADITWKWIGWIGVIPLVTALIGWCPLYTVLGIRSKG
ncbi:DUF2892 domain-containing protein [Breoghania sp.]|uniref:YgaP family membrane protein n=1 Tax=Breoghania sp. TaxID=2065378 RepID=UPI002AA7D8E5|nr:DUF2892 domain-containing protein [Breoghania sp.]